VPAFGWLLSVFMPRMNNGEIEAAPQITLSAPLRRDKRRATAQKI